MMTEALWGVGTMLERRVKVGKDSKAVLGISQIDLEV